MKRTIASSIFVLLVADLACSPKSRVMQRISLTEKESKNELTFPEIFCGDRLCAAARNCAQLYNGSVDENQFCSKFSTYTTLGASISIATTGVATGIASTVDNDKARQHYTAVGLTFAALASGLFAFQGFLNCSEREGREFAYAEQRLRHLETAAHLLRCAIDQEQGRLQNGIDSGRPGAGPCKKDELLPESEKDRACGRLVDGTYQPWSSPELRDRANAELLRCISLGSATGYGPLPSIPRIQ
jgi:hypothetical protein